MVMAVQSGIKDRIGTVSCSKNGFHSNKKTSICEETGFLARSAWGPVKTGSKTAGMQILPTRKGLRLPKNRTGNHTPCYRNSTQLQIAFPGGVRFCDAQFFS